MDPRDRLIHQRGEVEARLTELKRQRQELISTMDAVNADDEHDPEGTTLTWERENLTALIQQAQNRLSAIQAAITRLDDGWAGDCADCGSPIPPGRLEARPEALRCVPCETKHRRSR